MSSVEIIVLGGSLVVIGIAVVRLGWRKRQGEWTSALGWTLVGSALILLARDFGAWGLAIGSLAGSGAAFVLLSHAWWASPRATARGEMLIARQPTGQPKLQPGRRLLTFVLVVPGAMAASALAGLATDSLSRASGLTRADGTVLGLFVFPLSWILLTTFMMTRGGPLPMLKPLGGTFVAGALLLWISA